MNEVLRDEEVHNRITFPSPFQKEISAAPDTDDEYYICKEINDRWNQVVDIGDSEFTDRYKRAEYLDCANKIGDEISKRIEQELRNQAEEKANAEPSTVEYEQSILKTEIKIDSPTDCGTDNGAQIFSSGQWTVLKIELLLSENEGEFPLHESVFREDMKKLTTLLDRGYDVTKKDKHGNTALHLAAMLGRKDFIKKLLKFNCPVRTRNVQGWTALDEAVSYGDEYMVLEILRKHDEQFYDDMMKKRREIIPELKNIDDFYMELQWEFRTWILGVSHFLPSDRCKIRKRGVSIRMDCTLAGFDYLKLRYRRGDVSFLFDGTSPDPTLVFMDNEEKHYVKVDFKDNSEKMNYTSAESMIKSDIDFVTMSTSRITFKRLTDWFRFNKTIGRFKANYYEVCGMQVKYRKRREHLTEQQKKKNKNEKINAKRMMWQMIQGIFTGESDSDDSKESDEEIEPVPPCQITWEQYIGSEPGMHPTLARPILIKEQLISVKTTIGMSKELPLPVNQFVKILEILAPFKHFNKLREFLGMKLPEGFPVKLDIPLIATISATVTFPEFHYCLQSEEEPFPEHLFEVPKGYKYYSGGMSRIL
ncbi:hypothetical protein V9T40_006253 [Parthenolecanium corni]|uniref:Ankyrin repeat domain-containing protein n=1 Tax=Parthenolecanium corni TaxID=536013 RepID=A0AAN9TWI5_9HEMI